MKNLILLIVVAAAFTLQSQKAWSQEDSDSLQQVELAAASVQQARSVTIIKISEEISYFIESTPNVDNMKKSLGMIIPDNVRERILKQGGFIPPEENPLEGYEGLSPEKKEQFQKTRLMFLQNVARALNSTKCVFGAGSIVGDSLSFVKESVMSVIIKKNATEAAVVKEKISFTERSQNAVQATLQALDYKLWNQAPLLLESNEFGLSASVGVLIENGVLKNGMGGSEELGLSFAYNKESKSFIFEIFHNSEKYSFTPAMVTAAGISIKFGSHFGQKDIENPTKIIKGTSFYPPVAPIYSSMAAEHFSAGFSTSIGFPPNPIVDMLSYTNKYHRNAIVRITVSPVMKGYVRLYIGDIPGSVKLVVFRVVGVYQWISQRVRQLVMVRGRSCEAVLL